MGDYSPHWMISPSAYDAMQARRAPVNIEARGEVAAAVQQRLPVTMIGDVAVIRIIGPMQTSVDAFDRMMGITSTNAIRRAVDAAAVDPQVREILLMVDSPGGSVTGIFDLADAVFAARQRKRVTAQVEGQAHSAAYLIASQAHRLALGRMDMIGSIGVILVLLDISRMATKEGIKPIVITTGKFKGIGTPGTKITDEQIAHLQHLVDTLFGGFVDAVARGRELSAVAVRRVADGRSFIGREAVNLGLADAIQPFAQTLAEIQGRAHPGARARSVVARMRMV